MPFQRVSFSGSMKNSQTVSGLAAIEIVRSTEIVSVVASMLLSLLLFRFAFQCLEPDVPELLQEVLELGEPFGTCSVQAPRAVPSLAHEPRLLQNVQVLGDRGPRDVEVRCDLPGAELVVADERENLPPPGRGDCLECGLHVSYVSRFLRKAQLKHAGVTGSSGGRHRPRTLARARGLFELGVEGRARVALACRTGSAAGGGGSRIACDVGLHARPRRRMAAAPRARVPTPLGCRRSAPRGTLRVLDRHPACDQGRHGAGDRLAWPRPATRGTRRE